VLSHQWALPRINLDLCTKCGLCAESCPGHAVDMTDDGPAFVRPLDCTYCTECEAACPEGAIRCEFVVGCAGEECDEHIVSSKVFWLGSSRDADEFRDSDLRQGLKESNHGQTTDCQD
jgi:formate hydrogenlyase subunit 6/NADH:ubiquinone oxidoreductase subunit I